MLGERFFISFVSSWSAVQRGKIFLHAEPFNEAKSGVVQHHFELNVWGIFIPQSSLHPRLYHFMFDKRGERKRFCGWKPHRDWSRRKVNDEWKRSEKIVDGKFFMEIYAKSFCGLRSAHFFPSANKLKITFEAISLKTASWDKLWEDHDGKTQSQEVNWLDKLVRGWTRVKLIFELLIWTWNVWTQSEGNFLKTFKTFKRAKTPKNGNWAFSVGAKRWCWTQILSHSGFAAGFDREKIGQWRDKW